MSSFSLLIRKWYRQNQRDLPWRTTKNPYFIWLSEIILQQTRVDQGLPYYKKFTSSFPTISDLANAEENEVLNLWQGLGYYSRARNLHTAAKQVIENYNGHFPSTYNEIRSLKGIGDYTAAAISSFSFDLPHPVVDGNVFRVLSRYFNESTPIDTTLGKKLFHQLATEVFNPSHAAEHNQAIMEFGALICTPKKPKCEDCPLQENCLSFRHKTILNLPVKAKKTKVRNRYFNYLVDKETPILYKRTSNDIWTNMFEFPMIETEKSISSPNPHTLESKNWSYQSIASKPLFYKKHILSHQHIHAAFWSVQKLSLETPTITIESLSKSENFPLPRIITLFLEEYDL